jgi:hypothetical protein
MLYAGLLKAKREVFARGWEIGDERFRIQYT